MSDSQGHHNIGVVEALNEAENLRDIQKVYSLIADDYKCEINGVSRSLEQTKEVDEEFFSAFPDYHRTFEDIYAVGDHVIIRWRITGTHKGSLRGLPATNASVNWPGCTIYEVKDGKLKSGFVYSDILSFLQQLGVLPSELMPSSES